MEDGDLETIVISEILKRCGSDKTAHHGYGPMYDDLFTPLAEMAKAVIEVGVYGGASVRAWHEFFRYAHIIGVDIGVCVDCKLPVDRFTLLTLDCREPTALADRVNELVFDICVDDGCHEPLVQVATFAVLYPRLRSGGIYVIEDVQSVADAVYIAETFGGRVVDTRIKTGIADDLAVVFVKP